MIKLAIMAMIRSKRKFPSLPYFWSLIDWTLPSLNPYKGQLLRAQSISDIAKVARKRTPKVVFDYVEGGAVDEMAYSRSRDAGINSQLEAVTKRLSEIEAKFSAQKIELNETKKV